MRGEEAATACRRCHERSTFCGPLRKMSRTSRRRTFLSFVSGSLLPSLGLLINMASRGANLLLPRASRIRQKLQSSLEARIIELRDVSFRHARHAAVKGDDSRGNADETHFNLKIVSSKFEGQSLVKRHQMVYEVLAEELQSGLHAITITAKTPKEVDGS